MKLIKLFQNYKIIKIKIRLLMNKIIKIKLKMALIIKIFKLMINKIIIKMIIKAMEVQSKKYKKK